MRAASVLRVVQPAVVLALVAVVIGVPLWLVLVTSAKTDGEAQIPNLSLPGEWNLVENYATVIEQGEVWAALFGSLLVTAPAVAGVLILGSLASWVLARRATRLNAVLYAIGISGIVLPPAVITIVLTLQTLGLDGTAVGMIGVYIGMFLGTVIFFVTGFIRSIPIDLEEAARIDGARPIQVFGRVILPLLGPVVATATILVTLFSWNEVFYAFFVLSGGPVTTLPLNLFQVAASSAYVNNWNLIFAYVVLMSLPMLLVFVLGQRRIVSGITSGAVK